MATIETSKTEQLCGKGHDVNLSPLKTCILFQLLCRKKCLNLH